MFNTLKQILLDDIKEEVEEAKALLDEIQQLEKDLQNLQEPKKDYEYTARGKYSFYEKYIRPYTREQYKKRKQLYIGAMKEYEEKKVTLPEKIKELRSKKDNEKLNEIIDKYNKIKNSKNIKDLGFSFEQAKNFFKERNIPFVLDETDQIIDNEASFDKLEDFCLVHKTSYAPSGDVIKTTGNAGATRKQQIQIGDQTIEIEYPLSRQTVHFTLNSEVKSHEAGNWDSTPYAIIVPLIDVPNVTTFRVEDTFTKGDVDISKGYMLCPVDEVENIQKNNPNLTVIGYKGNINPQTGKECVSGVADKLLSQLGYKQEEVISGYGQKPGWSNQVDEAKARATITNNMKVVDIDHDHSKEGVDEDIEIGINQYKAIVEKLFESNIDFDPAKITSQLSSQLLMNNKINGINRYEYPNGKALSKVATALWAYGIELPSYLDIMAHEMSKLMRGDVFDIDSVITRDNKINYSPNYTPIVSKDTKEYIEKMKQRKGKEFDSSECLQELVVYETLKQVKALNQKNINQQESAKEL
ncbi:MAG: hypothetical protein IKF37_00980 [Bacilli bacterium]|nr:hypothetical protein [Bacilli bacterium]